MSNRPTGITILAILALIGGLYLLFIGGFSTVIGPMVGLEMTTQTDDATAMAVGGAMTIMGIGTLVVGIFQLVAAYGLFTLKSWAWILMVIMQVLSLIMNGFKLTAPDKTPAVVAVVIAAVILYYLFRPTVKQAFGRT